MHIFELQRVTSLLLTGLLCRTALLARAPGADPKDEAAAKPTPTVKTEAPAPITARERMLLDRLEELEKRFAELEAKAPPPPAAQPIEAVSPIEGVSPPDAASAISASLPVAPGNSVGAQATEKSKAGRQVPSEPFGFADFTWLNGNARTKEVPLDTKFFTPEIRADVAYVYSFNTPRDDTIGGSSEVFRHGEVQVTQLGVGGDFHYDNVRARLMTQFGMYSQ